PPHVSTRFPYTTLFRSSQRMRQKPQPAILCHERYRPRGAVRRMIPRRPAEAASLPVTGGASLSRLQGQPPSRDPLFSALPMDARSEEHTSELQSPCNLV